MFFFSTWEFLHLFLFICFSVWFTSSNNEQKCELISSLSSLDLSRLCASFIQQLFFFYFFLFLVSFFFMFSQNQWIHSFICKTNTELSHFISTQFMLRIDRMFHFVGSVCFSFHFTKSCCSLSEMNIVFHSIYFYHFICLNYTYILCFLIILYRICGAEWLFAIRKKKVKKNYMRKRNERCF